MTATFALRRNQKVILKQRLDESTEGQPYEFVVEAVDPDEVLLLPVETSVNAVNVLTPGEIVKGFVPGDPPYQFQSIVIRARKIPTPMVLISAPKQISVVERRRYFRLKVLFDAKVSFVLDEQGNTSELLPATGIDISSMGVGLHLKLSQHSRIPRPVIHQRVKVLGTLPPVQPEFSTGLSFEAEGEIRNITEIETGWRLGIMFTSVERRTQDLIVAWCFAFQRRLKREGLPLLNGEVVFEEIEVKGAQQR